MPNSVWIMIDEILTACFQYSPVMGWIMAIIAGMTAFYLSSGQQVFTSYQKQCKNQ